MTNLILIDCHDLGQHLGCYGWPTVPSPNLDALAAEGARFTNSFCTAPQCSPSRAALYTGRYPHANGMMGLAHPPFDWRLHDDERHLARLLRDAGYATAQVGTQHVTAHTVEAVQALGFDQVRPADRAAEIADHAIDFLTHPPAEPFFLNIGFVDPHRDREGLYGQAPPDVSLGVAVPSYLPQSDAARGEFARVQGVIAALDAAVGRILAALAEAGAAPGIEASAGFSPQPLDRLKPRFQARRSSPMMAHDTWVIFTTDHGLAMPRAKCTLYDPGLKTALIVAGPAPGATGGRVYDELVSNVDLVPTILELLGLPRPLRLHGQSFADLLLGRETGRPPRAEIFAEKTFHTAYEPQRCVRTGRFKLIWNVEAGIMNVPGDVMRSPIFPEMIQEVVRELPHFELYDLALDPGERTNLWGDPRYADVGAGLRGRLLDWMRETGDPLLDGPVASPFYRRGLGLLTGPAA